MADPGSPDSTSWLMLDCRIARIRDWFVNPQEFEGTDKAP
jgi:hypothetical protein